MLGVLGAPSNGSDPVAARLRWGAHSGTHMPEGMTALKRGDALTHTHLGSLLLRQVLQQHEVLAPVQEACLAHEVRRHEAK